MVVLLQKPINPELLAKWWSNNMPKKSWKGMRHTKMWKQLNSSEYDAISTFCARYINIDGYLLENQKKTVQLVFLTAHECNIGWCFVYGGLSFLHFDNKLPNEIKWNIYRTLTGLKFMKRFYLLRSRNKSVQHINV